jgi:hypothetical protein
MKFLRDLAWLALFVKHALDAIVLRNVLGEVNNSAFASASAKKNVNDSRSGEATR